MHKSTLIALIFGAALMLVLAACGGQNPNGAAQESTSPPAAAEEMAQGREAEHDEEAEGPEHGGEAHGVEPSADELENPVESTEASIARGKEVYAANCVACHGDTGLGDGIAGKAMNPPPANLHEDHVQILTDGAMFAIIHNGVDGTGMPGFEDVIEEEDIWNVINYIRTFKEK